MIGGNQRRHRTIVGSQKQADRPERGHGDGHLSGTAWLILQRCHANMATIAERTVPERHFSANRSHVATPKHCAVRFSLVAPAENGKAGTVQRRT
jgi:hypothetical protein